MVDRNWIYRYSSDQRPFVYIWHLSIMSDLTIVEKLSDDKQFIFK